MKDLQTRSAPLVSIEIPFLLRTTHTWTHTQTTSLNLRSIEATPKLVCILQILQPWRSKLSQTNSTSTIFGALITHSCCKQCPFPIPRPRPQTQWGLERPQWCIAKLQTSQGTSFYGLQTIHRRHSGPGSPPNATTSSSSSFLPFCHNQILQALIPRVRRSSTLIQPNATWRITAS